MERVDRAVPVLVVLIALTAGGCSAPVATPGQITPSVTSPSAVPSLSASDHTFVAELLANQRQAVEIGALLATKSGVDPQVRVLAEDIRTSQQLLVRRLEGWPGDADTGGGDAGGRSSAAGDTGGSSAEVPLGPAPTLPGSELAELAQADGVESGRIYLQAMVGSHIVAVRLSRTEVEQGSDPAAVALATQVVDDRGAEIDQLQVLLGGV